MRRLLDLLPFQKPQASVKQSKEYSAHIYLGKMYLTLGQSADAEIELSQAQTIWASEECAKLLTIARNQRLAPRSFGAPMAFARRSA